jgi:hypothetical protein
MALFTFPKSTFLILGVSLASPPQAPSSLVEPILEARVRPRVPQPEFVSATGIPASLTVAARRLRTDTRTIAQPPISILSMNDVDILGVFPIRT